MTGLAFIGSTASPNVTVVAPLKPERIYPAEFIIYEESFIYLNADSCSKSVALLGSTNTLCTSKPLIQRVRIGASKWGTMTLFGLIGGKDIGRYIGLVSVRLPSVWMAFTLALIVAILKSFFYWRFD